MEKFINITWHIDDLRDLDKNLTDAQACEILASIKNNHDSSIGINWDVLETSIDTYKQNKGIE